MTVVAALVLLGISAGANAASVTLVPTTPVVSVAVGDTVSFDIYSDFSGEPTWGGGFDVVFDSDALAFRSLFRNPDIGHPDYSRDPIVADGLLDDWIVSDFNFLPALAFLGSVSFLVLTTEPAVVALTDAREGGVVPSLAGGWVAFAWCCISVDYNSIDVNPIPLPGTAWFLLSGTMSFLAVGFRRRFAFRADEIPSNPNRSHA